MTTFRLTEIAASLSFCCSSFPRNICMKSLENDCLLLFGWMIESPVILLFSLRFLMLCWSFKRMEVCVLSAELVEIFYKKMSLANFHHSAFTFHLHAFGWQIYVKLGIVLVWDCCWKLAACLCWILKALEVVDILFCQSRSRFHFLFPVTEAYEAYCLRRLHGFCMKITSENYTLTPQVSPYATMTRKIGKTNQFGPCDFAAMLQRPNYIPISCN